MNKKGLFGWLILFFILGIFLLLIVGTIYLSYDSVDEIRITIKNKERINKGTDSYYLIFTENEVFQNKDSLLFMKFDSSDVYNNLDIGETYQVKVNWYRINFLSEYRNILEILE